jgi:hypothetical protein
MSVHMAVASKSDDERARKAVTGMSCDERKAFSSKGAYLSVTHAKCSLASAMMSSDERKTFSSLSVTYA